MITRRTIRRSLLVACLILLLSACAPRQSPQKPLALLPPPPIPASMTTSCPVPVVPVPMTVEQLTLVALEALNSLEICNGRMRSIREIEEGRQKALQDTQ